MEKLTVVQPNLNFESHLVARAVALGDLGTAGMDGPEAFLKEGDTLFREEQLDVARLVRRKQILNIPAEHKTRIMERIVKWSGTQPKFAEGRRDLLEAELEGLTPDAKQRVAALFPHFDSSIAAAKEQLARRQELLAREDFVGLLREVGYAIPE
jgi:hypothetical protein